jgi:hypothetical protein
LTTTTLNDLLAVERRQSQLDAGGVALDPAAGAGDDGWDGLEGVFLDLMRQRPELERVPYLHRWRRAAGQGRA